MNNFPRFQHSFIFSTVLCGASRGSLNGIYPSSLLTIATSASSAHIFRGEAGCVHAIPLIGAAQKKVRGKLMTPATDASFWEPKLRLRIAGLVGIKVCCFETQQAVPGSVANH